ncbi:MAG: hypothetical protein E6K70_24175 [Planctomycetota bacterium]|nr:MAG: hypothetical protein E6K70_24175 [Planctomycetota bacterium]
MAGKNDIPILKVRKGATLREIYARARQEFTAADLQKYTVLEEGVPVAQVIEEMEAIQRKATAKQRKKRKA